MAKDPAFLFYPGDWQGGTSTLTRHLKGCYLDLLIAQFNSGHLSIEEIKTVLGTDFAVWGTLSKKFKKTENGLFFNEKLQAEQEKRRKYSESRRNSRLASDEDMVRIYFIKDLETGYIKIGSSVNPQRRLSEMLNQKKPAITVGTKRDYILLWQSECIERKIEFEIHSLLKEKNITGEWFDLSKEDITYVKTYVERTLPRMENENIIPLDINNKIEVKQKTYVDTYVTLTKMIEDYKLANPLKYSEDVYLKFKNYWEEKNQHGKMRWQCEKFFELPNRLATWNSRAKAFEKPTQYTTITPVKKMVL